MRSSRVSNVIAGVAGLDTFDSNARNGLALFCDHLARSSRLAPRIAALGSGERAGRYSSRVSNIRKRNIRVYIIIAL